MHPLEALRGPSKYVSIWSVCVGGQVNEDVFHQKMLHASMKFSKRNFLKTAKHSEYILKSKDSIYYFAFFK